MIENFLKELTNKLDLINILKKINEVTKLLSDKLDILQKRFETLSKQQGPQGIQGPPGESIVGPPGPDGKPGADVHKEEVVKAVLDLIPLPKDGEDGKTPEIDYALIIREVSKKVPKPKDGKDAIIDYTRVIADVLKKVPKPKDGKDGKSIVGPAGKEGLDGSPDTADQIRDKLELLNKGSKLSIQAIEDLPELLKNFIRVGSTSANRQAQYINFVDDETPDGIKNSSNTKFTLAHTPVAGSLKVYRNGARQRVTEDYTFSAQTITFTAAPDSDEIILVDYRY